MGPNVRPRRVFCSSTISPKTTRPRDLPAAVFSSSLHRSHLIRNKSTSERADPATNIEFFRRSQLHQGRSWFSHPLSNVSSNYGNSTRGHGHNENGITTTTASNSFRDDLDADWMVANHRLANFRPAYAITPITIPPAQPPPPTQPDSGREPGQFHYKRIACAHI